MNQKCNPMRKKGERNIFYSYYSDCLDYAIENTWAYWACDDFQHRLSLGAGPDIQVKVDDSIAYHDLPPDIHIQLGERLP